MKHKGRIAKEYNQLGTKKKYCENVFIPFYSAGERIIFNEPKFRRFHPVSDKQTLITFCIYQTDELVDPNKIMYVDQPNMTLVSKLEMVLHLPHNMTEENALKREAIVTFYFGGTEIRVAGKDALTDKVVKTKLIFDVINDKIDKTDKVDSVTNKSKEYLLSTPSKHKIIQPLFNYQHYDPTLAWAHF